MKQFYYLSSAILFLMSVGSSVAQNAIHWGDVPVIGDSYGHYMTRDGSFSTGEAVMIQSGWGRDNNTGEIFLYENCRIGHGNSVSQDHVIVGNDNGTMKAVILQKGEIIPIEPMSKYSDSYAYCITWDGTRIAGIVANPRFTNLDEYDPEKMRMMYLPVYCDVDPDSGVISDVKYLPVPPKDFFGSVPQYCTAVWISDDGKTILGQVIDNTGFFVYPIVYKEDNSGNWSYTLPSESLFNEYNLPIPQYPEPSMQTPQVEDYILNPEKREEFIRLRDLYLAGDYSADPYDLLDPSMAGDKALMTQEEWDAYNDALWEYTQWYEAVYEKELNNYFNEFARFLSGCSNFVQNSMAMNSDGTLISQTRSSTRPYNGVEPIKGGPMIFDIEEGNYKALNVENSNMQVLQILSDGTFIGVSSIPGSIEPIPQLTYVMSPNSDNFVPLQDYIKTSNPDVHSWMQEYLTFDIVTQDSNEGYIATKPYLVTGNVSVSDDFSALSGGLDAWAWDLETGDYYTYFLTGLKNPDAGIEELQKELLNNSDLEIYNLQGVKVRKGKETLEGLRGIYIINGKKVYLK